MQTSFEKVRMDKNNANWEQANTREIPLYGRNNDIRTEFERDYTRLMHCQAYSRLKHKTQVFYAPKNDHVCTRMEHVGHVASVATTISKYLGLNEELTRAIAIGHDIGHAPFGHTGEEILNSLMEQKTGANAPKKFWHERNSLFFADYKKLLDELSQKYDYIIIDTPPINVVSDAMVMKDSISGILLVIRYASTTYEELSSCMKQIELAQANMLGFVMNDIHHSRSSSYYNYKYKYKYKKYGYGHTPEQSISTDVKEENKNAD